MKLSDIAVIFLGSLVAGMVTAHLTAKRERLRRKTAFIVGFKEGVKYIVKALKDTGVLDQGFEVEIELMNQLDDKAAKKGDRDFLKSLKIKP